MTGNLQPSNLERLLKEATRVRQGGGKRASGKGSRDPHALAWKMPLSHTTTAKNFGTILESGELLSRRRMDQEARRAIDPKNQPIEYVLSTEDDVFLFAGPFSYPQGTRGFLWEAELERVEDIDGDASPFDSGGLVRRFTLPDPREPHRAFLDRHRLPLWEHRRYLERKLLDFFEDAGDYITVAPDEETSIIDPVVGLTGGDRRRWTHEVRVNDRLPVELRLLAVFVSRGAALAHSSGALREWRARGVEIVWYQEEEGGDFAAMWRECIDFLDVHLGVSR